MTRREEIEQAAMQVGGVHPDWDALECFRVGYKEGAKWADKTMIQKAGEWVKEQDMAKYLRLSAGMICVTTFDKELFIKDFLKAMEE